MKTKSFRLLTVLLTAVMLIALSLNVYAAQSNAVTQDGLTAQLFTDKDSYKSGESVNATVRVDNHTGREVFILTSVRIPDGVTLANESAVHDAVLQDGETWTTPDGTVSAGIAAAGSTTATGDNMQAGFWVILTALAVGGIIALFVYGKNRTTWLSMLLCLAMVGGMVTAAIPVQASGISGSMEVSCIIQLDSKDAEVSATVEYLIYDDADEEAEEQKETIEPSEESSEPSVENSEPNEESGEPSEESSEPSSDPSEESSDPSSDPSEESSQPSSDSSEESSQPSSDSSEESSQPSSDPSEESSQPSSDSSEESSQPSSDSSEESSEPSSDSSVATVGGSYYTVDRINAARENIAEYDWAKDTSDSLITSLVDPYIQYADKLYYYMGAYELPVTVKVAFRKEGNQKLGGSTTNNSGLNYCNYCGKAHKNYSTWRSVLRDKNWKLTCASCNNDFPTNDFDKFYQLGLVDGAFDYATALEKHREMFGDKSLITAPLEDPTDVAARYAKWTDPEFVKYWYAYYGYGVEGGYLTNETIPGLYDTEKDPVSGVDIDPAVWGVDDGYGYFSNNYYTNNSIVDSEGNKITLVQVDTYIAHFLYWAYYYTTFRMSNFAEAYVYTGNEEYGIAAAKLVDRLADIFPYIYTDDDFYVIGDASLSTAKTEGYYTAGGNSMKGKIFGRVTDAKELQKCVLAADAVYPLLVSENETLIEYLSEKATEYNLDNDKTTGEKIWQNWKDNLMYQMLGDAKKGHLSGNAGYLQSLLVSAALVLNEDEGRSQDLLDFVYTPALLVGEKGYNQDNVLGGNVGSLFVNKLDRDGMGDESAPGYNLNWLADYADVVELTKLHTDDGAYSAYDNPKFANMFVAGSSVTLAGSYQAQIGDTGATAITTGTVDSAGSVVDKTYFDSLDSIISGFKYLKDSSIGNRLAEYIYARKNYDIDDLHYDIFTDDPESLKDDILERIDEDLTSPSEMMAGYGFAALRDGEETAEANTLRDFWMYFGINNFNTAHAHVDSLNLGIDAYGLNMAPEIGLPSSKDSSNQERFQWVKATLSHNTVVVDTESQKDIGSRSANPLHFDDAGEVKVMDVDASNAYEQTDTYRRTVVMVNVGDDVSYGVDFFRILGGSDHIYSFHSQCLAPGDVTTDLTMVEDVEGADEYSYAGSTIAFGEDPSDALKHNEGTYPDGFTWLKNVRRASNVDETFTVNFKITDSQGIIEDEGLNLRMTMLNDFKLNEVAIASGSVPDGLNVNYVDTLEYVLARRTAAEGETLDSLYTTVFEPYNGTEYISEMAAVEITTQDAVDTNDVAKAVKVVRTDGRTDYIVYATNNNVLYTITDGDVSFAFRGFVGVYSVDASGTNIYSYVCDGDVIGDVNEAYTVKAYTGTVASFTEELVLENYIYVQTADNVDVSKIIGRYVYVDNQTVDNGAYKIENAEMVDGLLKLDIGMTSLVTEYQNDADITAGYVYNIASGNSITIPLSYVKGATE